MNRVGAISLALHFDLAACDQPIAQDTNALVVERIPFPPKIRSAENCQFLFREDCRLGFQRTRIGYERIGKGNRPRL